MPSYYWEGFSVPGRMLWSSRCCCGLNQGLCGATFKAPLLLLSYGIKAAEATNKNILLPRKFIPHHFNEEQVLPPNYYVTEITPCGPVHQMTATKQETTVNKKSQQVSIMLNSLICLIVIKTPWLLSDPYKWERRSVTSEININRHKVASAILYLFSPFLSQYCWKLMLNGSVVPQWQIHQLNSAEDEKHQQTELLKSNQGFSRFRS